LVFVPVAADGFRAEHTDLVTEGTGTAEPVAPLEPRLAR